MQPIFTFESAMISRGDTGPDTVVLIGKYQSGETEDFDIQLSRNSGEAYLRARGFKQWIERAPGEVRRLRSNRPLVGIVDTLVTADGQRTVLTKQATGFAGPTLES